jgi:hypothetical protein
MCFRKYEGVTPTIVGSGDWTSLPLLQNQQWNEANCAKYAINTCKLLRGRPELDGETFKWPVHLNLNKNSSLMFARMPPGTHLNLHTGGHNTQLSLHLGITGLEGAKFQV